METVIEAKAGVEGRGGILADRHEAIRRRAEEIYLCRGRIPGRDIENWVQAKAEILREAQKRHSRRTGIVVRQAGSQTGPHLRL